MGERHAAYPCPGPSSHQATLSSPRPVSSPRGPTPQHSAAEGKPAGGSSGRLGSPCLRLRVPLPLTSREMDQRGDQCSSWTKGGRTSAKTPCGCCALGPWPGCGGGGRTGGRHGRCWPLASPPPMDPHKMATATQPWQAQGTVGALPAATSPRRLQPLSRPRRLLYPHHEQRRSRGLNPSGALQPAHGLQLLGLDPGHRRARFLPHSPCHTPSPALLRQSQKPQPEAWSWSGVEEPTLG